MNFLKVAKSPILKFAVVGLTVMAVCNTASAFADDEARKAILDLRETVKQMQSELSLTRNAQMQLMTEINMLKERNRQLTGLVEELTNELTVEKRSTRELYGTLDKRFEAFEPQTVEINGETFEVQPQEKRDYDNAVLLLQDGKYKEAAKEFSIFLKAWPKSPYRAEALFWQGTSQFAAEDYKGAIVSQNQLIKEFPKSPRAADAMVLVGSSQASAGNIKAATATFQKVVKQYPKTEAATTAQARLKAITKK